MMLCFIEILDVTFYNAVCRAQLFELALFLSHSSLFHTHTHTHKLIYVVVITYRLHKLTAPAAEASSAPSSGKRDRQRSPEASSMLKSISATVNAKTPSVDEEKNDMMRAGLLSKVFDHISLLVEDWFVGVRPRTSVIPCPFCSEDISRDLAQLQRSFSDNPILMSPEERVERGLPVDLEQQPTQVCVHI